MGITKFDRFCTGIYITKETYRIKSGYWCFQHATNKGTGVTHYLIPSVDIYKYCRNDT